MRQVVTFDAYGTLFDVHSVIALCEQAEPPDGSQRGVELEPDVEPSRQARENGKRNQRQEDADHESRRHCVATFRPRGLRTIRTARMTNNAITRGKPMDWIQMVG